MRDAAQKRVVGMRVHHRLHFRMRAVDLAVDGCLVGRGMPVADTVAFAIEIDAADIMHSGEGDPALVAAAAPEPHLVRAWNARAHVTGGLVHEAEHPQDAAGNGNFHSEIVDWSIHSFLL